MATQPVPSMTPVPNFPALSERAAGTYNASAYAFGNHMATTFNAELLAVADNVKNNADDAKVSADDAALSVIAAAEKDAAAAASASAAAASANTAAASAGGQLWVSGTTYAVGALVFSAVTGRNYRRIVAGAGTTDPSADSTNWRAVLLDVDTRMPTIRPTLLLDFANSRRVDPRITFTRSSTALRTNEKGLLETVGANVPRIDFDPVSGACKGLLVEERRTNLLLNSLITGADLATQTVTVTAVTHTISFYGSGSVNLSGAHSATVNGGAAYPTRTFLTFTPSAGSLVVTVTGSVQFAQLEVGSSATSYIPTTTAQVTRAADVATMTGTNFSSWYRQDEGTLVIYRTDVAFNTTGVSEFEIRNDAGTNIVRLRQGTIIAGVDVLVVNNGTTIVDLASFAITKDVSYKAAIAFKKDDFAFAVNGSAAITDITGDLGAMTRMQFANDVCSTYERIAYYPKRLSNAELQALTTP